MILSAGTIIQTDNLHVKRDNFLVRTYVIKVVQS